MATIDLIVLGMLKKEPMGAYDIQKLVEYRNISKWVKISTSYILPLLTDLSLAHRTFLFHLTLPIIILKPLDISERMF